MHLSYTEEGDAVLWTFPEDLRDVGAVADLWDSSPRRVTPCFSLEAEPPRNGCNVTRSMVEDFAFLREQKFTGKKEAGRPLLG